MRFDGGASTFAVIRRAFNLAILLPESPRCPKPQRLLEASMSLM